MAAAALRPSPDMANGGSNPHSTNGSRKAVSRKYKSAAPDVASYEDVNFEPTNSDMPNYSSAQESTQGHGRQSFSTRAGDRPAADLNYTTRKPALSIPLGNMEESTTPRGLPPAEYTSEPDPAMQSRENASPAASISLGQPSPLSRSNTSQSTAEKRRDWASDRSPLQKLEVTLNGISKEEKRARVQEAEMRLRERLARQKAEREKAASRAESTAVVPPPSQMLKNRVTSERPRTSGRKDIILEDAPQGAPVPRQSGGVTMRHTRNVSTTPQYPAIQRPAGAHHSQTEVAVPVSAKLANVPRRSVTVSGPNPGPPSGYVPPVRSVSQSGPSKPLRVAAVAAEAAEAERVETPPALRTARAAQESVESHQKSKREKQTVSFDMPPPTPPPVFEWKNAPIARLAASDFDFQHLDINRSKAWWEGGASKDRRKSRALPKNYQTPAQKLTGVTEHKNFQPKLFLRCGPLLRYTGIKKVNIDGSQGPVEKEIWRGSILIVTKDSRSSYENPPTLRLFSQPMDLLPPPPAEVSGADLAPEYIDPTAGLMKVGRDGRPLYVKPVDHLEEEVDLSGVENDDGIYELSPSMIDHTPENGKQPIPSNRINSVDGETAEFHRDVPGVRLYADSARDVTFWRFNLEIELSPTQQRIAYRINQGPALGFWVPAMGQSMNIMFHSGNGFSPSVDSNRFCGPDPLWRDILNEHQTRPFHVMIGGGDQIFNDSVITDSTHFQEWMKIKNAGERYGMPFTAEFRAELEQFYLERYASWFSQGLFSLANSQIPMVNMWNDHEIFEGFGSYHDDFMQSMIISGLGRIAFKYYLLFQHHSVPEETEADEPSWLLGAHPGPYIEQRSRNLFMSLGNDVVLLGLDCRTERRSNEVLAEETCDLIWDRCHRDIIKGQTKHLIVLSSVPIAYPRVAMLKSFLNSRKSLGKSGMLGGLVNRSGGNVEVFDDHWAGKHLKSERTWLVEDLQDLAAEKSVRVTILSGDAQLAAVGQFYSNTSLAVSKDRDYRYMPNVISSGIANMPETELISDMLNKRNTVHHMDSNTDEDMIPIFTQDVDGKPRNNKRLLPRRNWCSIREYLPGSTPLGTPESEMTPSPEPRPGKLQRTLSLGRGDKGAGGKPPGLLRRLDGGARRSSIDGPVARPHENGDSYFPNDPQAPEPGRFHRRPTNLSLKAVKKAAKQGDDGAGALVDLEGGLAITFNMEISPQDPSGITVPYKLLVPALRYEGTEYDPPPTQVVKGWRKWLPRRKKRAEQAEHEADDDDEPDDYEDHDTINNTRANAATETNQYQYEGYSGSEEDDSDEVAQRLPPDALTDSSPDEKEYDEPRQQKRKKWFGMI
ncbi:uncharacterized protein N7477_009928 [Penicillium maclennaniae]|uniref:uncharacterized protein n=1 Tax=Penicillium maclennaniae TaxID=1343394 RepID=UPI0025420D62|nr:uncharacterized protein N7477_009928 [Penicillium maclennaniae]KAJ5662312.1 hypothetical protein N7477_009928 [Penicillium maclennaniae]